MRTLLSQTITQAAKDNPNLLVLSGDHGYALFDEIRRERPGQFLNVGIIEQAMIGVAAGLAKTGMIPVVYGLAAFLPIRVLEQIKIDLCHSGLKAVILGDGAGLVYSTLGVSHQCGEDLGALRAMPGLRIYTPGDREELAACFREALSGEGPAYIRIGKSDAGEVHPAAVGSTEPQWIQAKGSARGRGLLVAHGSMIASADRVARKLGLACASFPRIKPFPSSWLPNLSGFDWLGVIEDHHRAGGLFAALAEHVTAEGAPSPRRWRSYSLADRFTEYSGSYGFALSEHHLDPTSLDARIHADLKADGIVE